MPSAPWGSDAKNQAELVFGGSAPGAPHGRQHSSWPAGGHERMKLAWLRYSSSWCLCKKPRYRVMPSSRLRQVCGLSGGPGLASCTFFKAWCTSLQLVSQGLCSSMVGLHCLRPYLSCSCEAATVHACKRWGSNTSGGAGGYWGGAGSTPGWQCSLAGPHVLLLQAAVAGCCCRLLQDCHVQCWCVCTDTSRAADHRVVQREAAAGTHRRRPADQQGLWSSGQRRGFREAQLFA